MDLRDTWFVIRFLKKEYSPAPYSRIQGQLHIGPSNLAKQAASHLSKEQWAAEAPFQAGGMPPAQSLHPPETAEVPLQFTLHKFSL
eukprot:9179407-Prorocentrum_lima.AAC.1